MRPNVRFADLRAMERTATRPSWGTRRCGRAPVWDRYWGVTLGVLVVLSWGVVVGLGSLIVSLTLKIWEVGR